jgi:hypothetical protein
VVRGGDVLPEALAVVLPGADGAGGAVTADGVGRQLFVMGIAPRCELGFTFVVLDAVVVEVALPLFGSPGVT